MSKKLNIKNIISKAIFTSLKKLPPNRLLPEYEFVTDFYNVTGQDINQHLDEYTAVINELQDQMYIRYEQRIQNKEAHDIIKGLNFDEWEAVMNKTTKAEQNINIGSVQGENLQFGNNNIQEINASPEELLVALKKLTDQSEEQQKSTLDQLKGYLEEGIDTVELIKRLIKLLVV